MNQITLVFDFDGTIADSLPGFIEVFNKLAPRYGYKELIDEQITRLRNKSAKEIIKELNISLFKLPFLVRIARNELYKMIHTTLPIKGIEKAIQELKKEGFSVGILSSNSEKTIQTFLEKYNLPLFDFTYSGSSLFGKDKVLKKLLRDMSLQNTDVIYIGDELRDIEAARKSNVRVASVSWGFNSREALKQAKPDYLIDTPEDLALLFKKTKSRVHTA